MGCGSRCSQPDHGARRFAPSSPTPGTRHGRRRSAEIVAAINTRRKKSDYLPGIALPRALRAASDAVLAVKGTEGVLVSIPAQALRARLTAWAPLIGNQAVFVSLMEGIETDTGLRMSEVITGVTGLPRERVAVISGPDLAREAARPPPRSSPARTAASPTRFNRRASLATPAPTPLPTWSGESSAGR
ncbi:hypothetical protein ACJ6WF_41395 [Streptomyces sp. MMS24-I2-30]|uniref:hypothetical protein n=1 Tax=Streptomyces sp. MMS24-I2-30 TaxID=3351564 RepID=UPI003896858B